MIYLTTIYYLVGGALCTLASLFMFGSYFKAKRLANLSLAFVFFWIGLHAFAFAIPTLIEPNNLGLLAFGYIIGIAMIFLTLLSGIEVQVFMAKSIVSKLNTTFASILITIIAIITLAIMAYDFRLPIVNPSGIIFWNINPLAAWLIGLSSIIYGFIWGHIFYRASLLVDDVYSRVKLIVISSNGFILGTVALLVHTSANEVQTIIGHALFIIAGTITLAVYLLPPRLFEFRQKS